MNRSWQDLYALTDEPPLWYGHEGVPRWCPFVEGLGVYWRWAVLVRIACQACGARFPVGVEVDAMDVVMLEFKSVEQVIEHASSSWGDPPAHRCVGDTMSSDFVGVMQVWKRTVQEGEVQLQ